jgi:PilZ domain
MEKRFCYRVNVNIGNCRVNKKGFLREARGTIENISLSGLFVKSDFQVKVNDRLRMTVLLPSDSGVFDCVAKVVRVEQRGIALTYDYLDPKEFLTLQSFLRPKDDRYY